MIPAVEAMTFYHSEKLQSTKTKGQVDIIEGMFYHSEKLQSTKTALNLRR